MHHVLEWRIDNIQRTIRSDETEQLISHTPSPYSQLLSFNRAKSAMATRSMATLRPGLHTGIPKNMSDVKNNSEFHFYLHIIFS